MKFRIIDEINFTLVRLFYIQRRITIVFDWLLIVQSAN